MTNKTDQVSYELGIENETMFRLTRFFHDGKCDTAASIDPLKIPEDTVSGINYLWFTYASSCYFSHQTNGLLEPIWTLDDVQLKSRNFKERAECVLGKNPPYLPQQVVYYSDGLLRHRVNGVASTNVAPPPYDHGFTNFTYETLLATNSGGIEIPAEFRFTRYSVETGTLRPIYIVTGRMDKFVPGASVSVFRPAIDRKLSIVDNMYAASNPPVKNLIFTTTNGSWDCPNLDVLYRQRLREQLQLGNAPRER